MSMTKHDLLEYLDDVGQANAHQIARVFEMPYATAAMALLRLTRQGLAERYVEPESAVYCYALSHHGAERLAYFEALEGRLD
jgi:DNA-binding MarR family transcriptional regulator